MGIDFDVQKGDVAARGNFCTTDAAGLVTDRRAGRISDAKCNELCQLLDGQTIKGIKVFVRPVREHRLVAVLRGDGLIPDVTDSDPQRTGMPPLIVTALTLSAEKLATVANEFLARAKQILAKHHPSNMVLLRGFSSHPDLPTMSDVFKLKPAAIASYPMYRGLAKLVGMDVLKTGKTIDEEVQTLKQNYAGYDFFFVHVKGTDTGGEDGNFDAKVKVIENVDKILPQITTLNPDVIVVAGDHSTPAALKGHSWHPVPFLLSSKWCRPGKVTKFGESACATTSFGRLPATSLMLLAMANALKLNKYGA
jgi:2,3-bisphosphoglycerate-independent phosphoglycerate mutase